MKKLISLAMSAFLVLSITGCSNGGNETNNSEAKERIDDGRFSMQYTKEDWPIISSQSIDGIVYITMVHKDSENPSDINNVQVNENTALICTISSENRLADSEKYIEQKKEADGKSGKVSNFSHKSLTAKGKSSYSARYTVESNGVKFDKMFKCVDLDTGSVIIEALIAPEEVQKQVSKMLASVEKSSGTSNIEEQDDLTPNQVENNDGTEDSLLNNYNENNNENGEDSNYKEITRDDESSNDSILSESNEVSDSEAYPVNPDYDDSDLKNKPISSENGLLKFNLQLYTGENYVVAVPDGGDVYPGNYYIESSLDNVSVSVSVDSLYKDIALSERLKEDMLGNIEVVKEQTYTKSVSDISDIKTLNNGWFTGSYKVTERGILEEDPDKVKTRILAYKLVSDSDIICYDISIRENVTSQEQQLLTAMETEMGMK